MINTFARRTSKRLRPLWDLMISAVGGFAFIGGLSPFAIGNSESSAASSTHAAVASRGALAGVGAELFLLAFIASEALATIRAFCL